MFPRLAPHLPPNSGTPLPVLPMMAANQQHFFTGIQGPLGSHCETACSNGSQLMNHVTPIIPNMRFPFFLPRLPEMTTNQMMMPALPRGPIPQTLFFSLSDLDLCLYGSTSWLSSASPESSKRRSYSFSGIRISQHLNDTIISPLTGEMVPLIAGAGWRSSKATPPVHDLPSACGQFGPIARCHFAGLYDVATSYSSLLPAGYNVAGLILAQTSFGGVVHYAVFCGRHVIPKGSRFGPFKGRVVNPSEMKTFDDNAYMWEIFKDGRLSHFLDGRGSAGNWMSYVNCARTLQEQNLVAIQDGDYIYYETCCDVTPGTELLVWYTESYEQFMGIPLCLQGQEVKPDAEVAETDGTGYQCEHCGKVFTYKYYKDKHLKYTKCVDQGDRKYPCQLCSRSFEKKDRLRIHVLHVHEKHRPHKCLVCDKSFSQSSSLNKHMRVHSGERPYKCVYCNKSFTASSILRTHIRQHSGERPFKCKFCGKAFASHAAHDSHVRRTHSLDKRAPCDSCGEEFSPECELHRHPLSHMGGSRPASTWEDVRDPTQAAHL